MAPNATFDEVDDDAGDRTTTTSPSSSFDEWSSKFSVDLVGNAHLHKLFLEKLHTLGVMLKRPSRESLRRYTDLWLPLVHHESNRHQGTTKLLLIPPSDVAWLWHCHRLAPRDYHKYMKDTFGPNVCLEANPPFTFQHDDINEEEEEAHIMNHSVIAVQSRDLWTQRYGTSESFFLQEDDEDEADLSSSSSQKQAPDASTALSGFDLLGSTERQATFLWQVSGPCFDDEDFLKEGVINYGRFLALKPKCPTPRTILVPTYQIDLIWHTHILSSLTKYDQNCIGILGRSFHHDDSLNDRTEGGILDTSYRTTRDLWKKIYGVNYVVQGGMYRGEPPAAYFQQPEGQDGGTAGGWVAAKERETEMAVRRVLEMGASSTTTSDYVIADSVEWHYWMDANPRGWQKYDTLAKEKLETFYLQSATKTQWTLKSGTYTYEVDVLQMTQRNTTSGKVRPIRRIQAGELYDLTTPPKTATSTTISTDGNDSSTGTGAAEWQYFMNKPMDGKQPGWQLYDANQSDELEAAYQDVLTKPPWQASYTRIKAGTHTYEVSFKAMTQRNVMTNTVRPIRRVMKGDHHDMTAGPPASYAWADINGKTSDGKDAFVAVGADKRRDLAPYARRVDYILGRVNGKTGYYHLETREAHDILMKRLGAAASQKKSAIAQAQCCCGTQEEIKKLEAELTEIEQTYQEIYKRSKAPERRGRVNTTTTTRDNSTDYYGHGGVWLYPTPVWDCAGGACGGGTACDAGGGGACAACGGGGCGGGGGGGGCGGGGCGGGGGG